MPGRPPRTNDTRPILRPGSPARLRRAHLQPRFPASYDAKNSTRVPGRQTKGRLLIGWSVSELVLIQWRRTHTPAHCSLLSPHLLPVHPAPFSQKIQRHYHGRPRRVVPCHLPAPSQLSMSISTRPEGPDAKPKRMAITPHDHS